MADNLINEMSKALIEDAMEAVLHTFTWDATATEIPLDIKLEMRAGETVTVPCSILLTARTKQPSNTISGLMAQTLLALKETGLVQHDRIVELHFARLSSFEETIELFITERDL